MFPVPNSPYGLCGRKATLKNRVQELCEVEVADLGSPSLIVRTVSADVNQHRRRRKRSLPPSTTQVNLGVEPDKQQVPSGTQDLREQGGGAKLSYPPPSSSSLTNHIVFVGVK